MQIKRYTSSSNSAYYIHCMKYEGWKLVSSSRIGDSIELVFER